MYEFIHIIELASPIERVWRALSVPSEVAQWDGLVKEAIDAPADYPRPGQVVVWRLRSGPFRRLVDRPQEVEAPNRLRSILHLGRIEMDETYTLTPLEAGCQLEMRVGVRLPVPVFGFFLEQLYIGPKLEGDSEHALIALRLHCAAAP